MAFIEEIPPVMVLAKEAPEQLIFRFRNRLWGIIAVAMGVVLIAAAIGYQLHHHLAVVEAVIVYGFAAIFFYSALYCFTADQFLVVDGKAGTVRFHKSNLYGKAEWERRGTQFVEIKVFRPQASRGGRARNWAIMLVSVDGRQLFLGENEFGSFTRKGAVDLAEKVARLALIKITADPG